jgi:hypothetical protein
MQQPDQSLTLGSAVVASGSRLRALATSRGPTQGHWRATKGLPEVFL